MAISLFKAYFVIATIATIIFKSMPEFYTWVILLRNQFEEIGKKKLSDFDSLMSWSVELSVNKDL